MQLRSSHALVMGFGTIFAVALAWYGGGRTASAKHAESKPVASTPVSPREPEVVPSMPAPSPVPVALPATTAAANPAIAVEPASPTSAPPINELVTRSEAQLASEAPDRAWAGPTAQKLSDGLRHASLEGIDVRSIECRSTTCRVDLHYAAAASQPRKVLESMCIGPTSEWSSLHVGCFLGPAQASSDGSGDGSIFVYRDGRMPQ